jgi:hypothetical protein
MIDPNNRLFISEMVACNHAINNLGDLNFAFPIIMRWSGTIRANRLRRGNVGEINFAVVETDDTLYCFFGGILDNPGRLLIMEGWSDPNDIENTQGWNTWAYFFGRVRALPLLPLVDFGSRQIVMVGHSAGAMVAEFVYSYVFGQENRPDDLWLLTGAPRALASGYSGRYGRPTVYRIQLQNDLFPCMPPRLDEWPEFVITAIPVDLPAAVADVLGPAGNPRSAASISLWPKFSHPPGGMLITDDGYGFAKTVPVPATGVIQGNFPFQQSFANIAGAPAHNLTSYVSAVRNWFVLNPGWIKEEVDEAVGSIGGGDWGREIGLICPFDNFGQIDFGPSGRIRQMSSIVQTTTVPMANGKTGGALYLRGQLVATFPSRSRAKTAAGKLNKFLAKLPTADEVSTSGLADGMLQYLNEAAIGGGVDKRPVRVVS